MKILIVGSLSNYAIERFYFKYLNKNISKNIEAKVFTAQDEFLNYYNKSLSNKLLFRSGFHSIYKIINDHLIEEINSYQPDYLLVFKGMEVYPSTLLRAIEKNVRLINYNPDNPFIFSGSGSGNRNVSDSVKLYDYHFSYNLQVKEKIENKLGIQCGWLPFGFDIDDGLYEKCQQISEVSKACFIGNPDHQRANFLREIANHGIEIDVYGNRWKKFLHHYKINIYDSVFHEEFWRNLYKYRVQLNPLRLHNSRSHSMRSFEVPAIGGIMLASRTKEHEMFFNENTECFYYNNTADAIKKIKYILNLTDSNAQKIRYSARERSLVSNYSYKNRASQFLTMLQKFEFNKQLF